MTHFRLVIVVYTCYIILHCGCVNTNQDLEGIEWSPSRTKTKNSHWICCRWFSTFYNGNVSIQPPFGECCTMLLLFPNTLSKSKWILDSFYLCGNDLPLYTSIILQRYLYPQKLLAWNHPWYFLKTISNGLWNNSTSDRGECWEEWSKQQLVW